MKRKEKNLTLSEIGKRLKPPITGERVRQIKNPKRLKTCPNHNVQYGEDRCLYCFIEAQYRSFLERSTERELQKELQRLGKRDRLKANTIQRRMLVREMHNKPYEYSFSRIGREMKRHHTSIMNLYYSNL